MRYGLSAVLTALVIAGRLLLDPWWGRHHNRHLIFLPTVMLAAFLAGLGPGLLSAAMCTAALGLYWSDDAGESFLRANSDLLLFAAVGAAICLVIQSLHAARQRADAARRAREQLLAVVAHDLRNPLNAVKLVMDRIQHSLPPETIGQKSARAAQRALQRMDHLIGDLVDATRVDQGTLVVERKPERLDALVQEANDLYAQQAQERGLTFDVATAPADRVVLCDRDRIMQVLGNLLGNAIKFTPSGGRISLRTAADGDGTVRFVVEDTGPGIAPEHQPHIFERYWKTAGGGTGLGLFIARNIVEAHDGTVTIVSQPGQGARFTVAIPAAPPTTEDRSLFVRSTFLHR